MKKFFIFLVLFIPFLSSPLLASNLDDRVSRLENIIANQNQQLMELNNLQSQVQELRGNVEVLTNTNAQLKQQQITYFSDLDQRLQDQEKIIHILSKGKHIKIQKTAASVAAPASVSASVPVAVPVSAASTAPARVVPSFPPISSHNATPAAPTVTTSAPIVATAPAAPTATTSAPVVATTSAALQIAQATELYQQALNLIKDKKYPEALNTLQTFLKTYPDSQYVPNAHYWLGEIALVQGRSVEARQAFTLLITQYPQNAKVPDSLLKIAFIDYENGHSKEAIEILHKIQTTYPNTGAANLAKVKLDSLNASASSH